MTQSQWTNILLVSLICVLVIFICVLIMHLWFYDDFKEIRKNIDKLNQDLIIFKGNVYEQNDQKILETESCVHNKDKVNLINQDHEILTVTIEKLTK